MKPNKEQEEILDSFLRANAQVIVVNALAGTGKTSTLKLIADHNPSAVYYLAFNARLLKEINHKLKPGTKASTFHSLARQSMHPFSPSLSFAKACPKLVSNYVLVADYSARNPQRIKREIIPAVTEVLTRFCHSAEPKVSETNVSPFLLEFRSDIVQDLISLAQEVFNFFSHPRPLSNELEAAISHDIYLKLFSLHNPTIPGNIILVDEAQDLNPCMLEIISSQIDQGKRVIAVGDSFQHLYGFRLAVDAMTCLQSKYPHLVRSFPLTHSYRFGAEIAETANLFLSLAASPWKITGLGPAGQTDDSTPYSGHLHPGKTFLFRSNFALLSDILGNPNAPVWVIGGTKEMESLMQALAELYNEVQPVWHGEIGVFRNWHEVETFAETIDGQHLTPLLTFVKRNNGDVSNAVKVLSEINEKCKKQYDNPLPKKPEEFAILSTVHKAKGLEFRNVVCAPDLGSFFRRLQENKLGTSGTESTQYSARLREVIERRKAEAEFAEVATAYVAVTRAKSSLQTSGLEAWARWAIGTGRTFPQPAPQVDAAPPSAPPGAAVDAPGHLGPAAPVVAPSPPPQPAAHADATPAPPPPLDVGRLQSPEVLQALGKLFHKLGELYQRHQHRLD